MLMASQLRKGTLFVYHGEPWQVLSFRHTHLARGGADVRVKIRGLISGRVSSQSFQASRKFEEAAIDKQTRQFLYREDSRLVFMHPISFEQSSVDENSIGKIQAHFLLEGEEILLLVWEDRIIGVELPPKITLTVKDCDPGVKGNSATNIYKRAELENGLELKVPLFIKIGDKIKVDTRSGEYVERA